MVKKFKIQKNGVDGWHEIEAITAQDAIETHYEVVVYPYEKKGEVTLFDDIRENVNQLYAAISLQQTVVVDQIP